MQSKETQDKIIQKIKICCESEANFQKHSPYLIEKAQSNDQCVIYFYNFKHFPHFSSRRFVKLIIDNIKKLLKDKKEPASIKFYSLLVSVFFFFLCLKYVSSF